jgi:hypothetical protein
MTTSPVAARYFENLGHLEQVAHVGSPLRGDHGGHRAPRLVEAVARTATAFESSDSASASTAATAAAPGLGPAPEPPPAGGAPPG